MAPGLTDAARFALRAVAWSLGLFGLLRLPWFATHVLLPVTHAQSTAAAVVCRHAADTHRGDAGLQRGRRVRAVPWNHPRLSGEMARAHRWRSRRRSTHPRPQHGADWHARTGRPRGRHGSTSFMSTSGPPCSCSRSRDTSSRGCASPMAGLRRRRWRGGAQRSRTVPRPDRCISDGVCGVVADLSRKLRRARARGLHRPCSRSDSERGRDHRLRRCQRALDSARRLPRDAGVHCNATGASVRRRGLRYSTSWRRLALGVLAAPPLFIALGIARLLVVALPGVAASPLFFVHAFYQLLLGAVVVFVAAFWRHGRGPAIAHAIAGLLVAVLFVYLLGPLYTRVVSHQAIAALDDPKARSPSCRRSRSRSISHCGSQPSRRSVGRDLSPASRCSGSPSLRACSRCRRSPAMPAWLRTFVTCAVGRSQGRS